MTLGLVLGPVSATVQSSYATEVSTEKSDTEKAYDMIYLIKAYVEDFEITKKSDIFRLASTEKQEALSKVMKEAGEYSNLDKVRLSELEGHIKAIEASNKDLVDDANANLAGFKVSIINLENLLKNHEGQKDSEEYKKLVEALKSSKAQLKTENLAKLKGDDLVTASKTLADNFKAYKEKVSDSEEYKVSAEDIAKLDEEIKKEEISTDKNTEVLNSDKEILVKGHKDFVDSSSFKSADDSKKKAYNDAKEALGKLASNANYNDIYKAVRDLAQARYNIEGKDLGLKIIKVGLSPEEIKAKTLEVIKKLKLHYENRDKLLQNFKDDNLKKDYITKSSLGLTYVYNYAKGIERDLKVYQELNDKLDELKAKIEKAKSGEVNIEKTKLDKLKDDIKKAEEFKKTKDFESASEDYKKKLNEEIEKAKKLTEKSSVTDDEAIKASEAIKAALANFTKFADKSKAKEGLEKLLKITDKVKIDQIYGKDQKELRDAYVNARENAEKSVKDFENKSLDDMQKSYDKFLESVNKLYEFLVTRLKNKVAEEKKFRETDTYKEALKDSKKEEAIKNHKHQIEEAEKILNETAPEANKLDEIYKKLVEARANIDKNMTDQVRKLIDAIAESQAFMKTDAYKKATSSSNKNLQEAAGIYKGLIEKAESFKKDGKLNTVEAEDLLDLINHTRDFIEGKISEKKYLNNKNYYILKSIKNHKNYKDINQASRGRLEYAMKLYELKDDDDNVFRAIDEAMNDEDIQAFLNKMKDQNNPNKTRNDLLIKLRTIVDKDEDFRKGEKYDKAPKKLKEDYDNALAEAKKIIGTENPTEKEVKDVYDKLKEAIDRIELRSIIDRRLVLLAEKFKKNQLKIGNPEDRKAIAAKINALQENPYTTIEDVDTVEKELDKLINTSVATTTVPSKPAVPQTVTPQSQTTFRPLSTITNPGSIVKTGIRGMAKVVGILVVALVIFKLTSKKGDKK